MPWNGCRRRAPSPYGDMPTTWLCCSVKLAENADWQRYQQVLTFRQEKPLPRGQLEVEADEWFIEWDTQRSLAELREVAAAKKHAADE